MYRLHPAIFSSGGINANAIRALAPAAWFRFGVGITDSGGGLVSQWADQSGNGRHLKQATATNQPAKQADGSILFDGVDNYLKCDAFTLNQPESIYLLMKQATWTEGDTIFDGNAANTGRLFQTVGSPQLRFRTSSGFVANNSGLALDTYGVLSCVANGAGSSVQVNHGTPTTGTLDADNMAGFTLCAAGNATGFVNAQVKEVIVFAAAHGAATRARVISYLRRLGGV